MYDSLITALNNAIRQNGTNAITGPVLNTVLNSVIRDVGAGMRFVGLATSSIRPIRSDYPKFYLSFSPGSYTNFMPSPPQFTSGFAVIYDAAGSNNWAMYVYSVTPFQAQRQFIADISVYNNDIISSDEILYVSRTVKSNNISVITLSKIDSQLQNKEDVITFTESVFASGYKTYSANLKSNSSAIAICVNWDLVQEGEYEYGIETSVPQSAYEKAENPAVLQQRIELLENMLALTNTSNVFDKPEYEQNGLGFLKLIPDANNAVDIEVEPQDIKHSFVVGRDCGKTVVIKNAQESLMLNLNAKNEKDFCCKFLIYAKSLVRLTIALYGIKTFLFVNESEYVIPENKVAIITVFGVTEGTTDNNDIADTYTVYTHCSINS